MLVCLLDSKVLYISFKHMARVNLTSLPLGNIFKFLWAYFVYNVLIFYFF